MPRTADALVQEQVDAYNRRDIDGFVACYGRRARITDAGGALLADGHAGLRAMYGPRFRDFPDLHAAIVRRIAVGQWIIDEELITGWRQSPVHAAAAYRVDDGLISSVTLYLEGT